MSVVIAEKRSASPIEEGDVSDPKKRMLATAKGSSIDCVLAALSRDGWAPAGISATSMKMLAAGFPHAAKDVSEVRHETQQALVAHVRDVLQDSLRMLKERARVAKEVAGQAEVAVDTRMKTLADKLQNCDLSRAIAEEAKQNHSKQVDVVKALEREIKSIESATKSVVKDKDGYTKEKGKVLAVKEGSFQELIIGDIGNEKETKKVTDQFLKDMAKFDTETSLVQSVLMVLSKRPEERRGFDDMVVDSVRNVLDSRISCLDAALEAINNQMKDADSSAAAKHAALVAARTEAARLAEALAGAVQERGEKTDSHMEASAEVDTVIISQKEAQDAVVASDGEVEEMEACLAVLADLATRTASQEPADATMGGA